MPVEVRCSADGESYRCEVTVSEAGASTRHRVRVSKADMSRWARGRPVDQLVKDSFDFLLERESKESILADFDLSVIKRYFPEYNGA